MLRKILKEYYVQPVKDFYWRDQVVKGEQNKIMVISLDKANRKRRKKMRSQEED